MNTLDMLEAIDRMKERVNDHGTLGLSDMPEHVKAFIEAALEYITKLEQECRHLRWQAEYIESLVDKMLGCGGDGEL